MHCPTPVDDFGYPIKFSPFLTPEERKDPVRHFEPYAIVVRWEISTSTYGGRTVSDNCDI